MKNFFSFVKSNWLFIFLAAAAFSLLGIYTLLPRQEKQPTPSPVPKAQVWGQVTPGQTTTSELFTVLGEPLETRIEQGYTVFSYSSESKALNNEVFVENNIVGLVKEQILDENVKLDVYKAKFGEPEASLYGPYATSGFLLYVFSSRGIAVLAHTDQGNVFEVWYFQPTTTPGFLRKWGQGLSQTPPQRL